jgi:hypothetical protein
MSGINSPISLKYAILTGTPADVIKEIDENEFDINHVFNDGNVLYWAICGASSINTCDRVGAGKYEIVKAVLEKGVNPNLETIKKKPIFFATKEAKDNMISLLANYNSDVNAYSFKFKKSISGFYVTTALIFAIQNQYHLCAEALITRDAVYSKQTIEYASKICDNLYKKRKEDHESYCNHEHSSQILIKLKENYNTNMETLIKSFSNATSKSLNNMPVNLIGM